MGTNVTGKNLPRYRTGRFADEETGLYYYRARAYDPATGRFLQRDPLGYGPGPNLYEYSLSAPANFVDPLGLLSQPPPDLQIDTDHLGTDPVPRGDLSLAYQVFGTLEQWLHSDWLEDADNATWFIRLRGTTDTGVVTELYRQLIWIKWRIEPTRMIETKKFEYTFITYVTWDTTNYLAIPHRQLAMYGERVRGQRTGGAGRAETSRRVYIVYERKVQHFANPIDAEADEHCGGAMRRRILKFMENRHAPVLTPPGPPPPK